MKPMNMPRAMGLALLALAIAACAGPLQRGTGSLSIQVEPGSSRSVYPAPLAPSELLYDLSLTRTGFQDIALAAVEHNQLVVSAVEAGEWSLTVVGSLKTTGKAVFQKTAPVTIVAGANTISWSLDPLASGAGDFEIAITWPADAANSAKVWLSDSPTVPRKTDISGAALGIFTGASPGLTIKQSGLASGSWYLMVELYKDGTSVASPLIELVRIYPNRTSSATLVLTTAELGKIPPQVVSSGIIADLPSPGVVTLSWSDSGLIEEGYNIYRDGTSIGQTASGIYSFTDTGAGGLAHTYDVKAFNQYGESASASLSWLGTGTFEVAVSANPSLSSLSFSSAAVTVYSGDTLSVTTIDPVLSGLSSGWSWYLDGATTPEAGKTGPTYSWVTADADAGQHFLNVAILSGGLRYSGSLLVTVIKRGTTPHNLTYYANGATGSPPASVAYLPGTLVPAAGNQGPAPLVRTGFTFDGWNTASDGSGSTYKAGDGITMGASAIELYAKWSPVSGVTVSYAITNPASHWLGFPNAPPALGAGTQLSVMTSEATLMSLPDWKWSLDGVVVPGMTSSTFTWTPSVADGGTHRVSAEVACGGIVYSGDFGITVGGNAPFRVSYSKGIAPRGSAPVDPNTYIANESATILGNTGGLIRSNYLFVGWTISDDGSGMLYKEGSTLAVTGNMTLYPKWSSQVAMVSSYYDHTLLLTADGRVYAMGSNSNGELGDGTTIDRSYPVPVTNGFDVVYVEAGQWTSFFIKKDGSLWAFGTNGNGQLGLGNNAGPVTTPTRVSLPGSARSVASGAQHTIVLQTDGLVFAMGAAGSAPEDARGLNGAAAVNVPTQVMANLTLPVVAVAAGSWHSLFLDSSGKVFGAGYATGGALGFNTPSVGVPTSITTFSAIPLAAIACGDSTSYFIASDNELYGAGSNQFAQLGLGDFDDRTTAAQVPDASALSVSMGSSFGCFMGTDGRTYAMGDNASGQFGSPSPSSSSVPVEILQGLTGISSIRTGGACLFLIRNDGSLWATGDNSKGKLGIGVAASVSAPNQVIVP